MEAKNYILDIIDDSYLLASVFGYLVFSSWKLILSQRKKSGVEIFIYERQLKPLSAEGHTTGVTSRL